MNSTSEITVRYAETDQMGIAHHSVYPVWFEVARTDFIKKVGMTYSDMEKAGVLLPLLEVHNIFRLPARYEDHLTVQVEISRLTPSKVEFSYIIYKEDEAKPIHTGSTLHAFVTKDMRPMDMRKHFPEIYQMFLRIFEN